MERTLPAVADLPRLEARFDVSLELASTDAIELAGSDANTGPVPLHLRGEPLGPCEGCGRPFCRACSPERCQNAA